MSKANRATGAILCVGMTLAAMQAMGQDKNAEARGVAKMLAALERPLEKRDLKGYCTAMVEVPEYTKYITRVCQGAVRNKLMQPEDCSDSNLKQILRKDLDRCLAMPSGDFEETALKWREARASFVMETKAKGIDGENLLQEERAKLR